MTTAITAPVNTPVEQTSWRIDQTALASSSRSQPDGGS